MNSKKIISLFAVLAILSSLFVTSALADVPVSVDVDLDVVSAADWIMTQSSKQGWTGLHFIQSVFNSDVCPQSSTGNGQHDLQEQRITVDGEARLCYVCKNCGKSAGEVMSTAYPDYVDSLPSNGYSSDGSVLWYSSWDDLALYSQTHVEGEGIVDWSYCSKLTRPMTGGSQIRIRLDGSASTETGIQFTMTYAKGSDGRSVAISGSPRGSYSSSAFKPSAGDFYLKAPISGTYFLMISSAYSIRYINASGSSSVSANYLGSSGSHHSADDSFYSPVVSSTNNYTYTSLSGSMYFPVFRIVPDLTADVDPVDFSTVYNTYTRMGNIGGNYGTVNNDNSVTQYTTQYIVNEGDNTYTNPATGESQSITEWSYDYDNRSYTLTLEGGDTTTVTYGDENVTIDESTTYINESGDTITTTNNYTIYYVVNNGSTDPDPSPSTVPGGPSVVTPSSVSRVFQHYPAQITQHYGNDGHGGTDCIPSSGAADTVIAHSEGDVVWVQTGQENNQGSIGNASYGNAVKIQHANGYYTLYAHLATVEVAQGDHVSKGQALGMMGNTGNSYGAHLHFEVRDDIDTRINSDPYINADLPGLSTGGDASWWSDAMGRLGSILGAPFVAELFSTVGGVFGQMWGWLPPEIAAVFTVGVTFLVVAAVMKFFL